MAEPQPQEQPLASILKLSPEILRLVFQYFCSHCCGEYQWPFGPRFACRPAQDNKTLYSLCLVSRYLRDIAQEVLYHSFDLDYDEIQENDIWTRRLEPFLETVATRPRLAHSVKAVFIQVPLNKGLNFKECSRVFDLCARSLGTSAREIYQNNHASKKPTPSKVKRAFFLGAPTLKNLQPKDFVSIVASELLTMLVSLLPSLTHLGVAEDFTGRNRWQVDVSTATLDALGINSIPLKTLESDRALEKLLSRTLELETLVTLGRGTFPDMPSVRNLHLRSRGAFIGKEIKACLSRCTGTLSTISYSEVDSTNFTFVKAIRKKRRFRTSVETLHLDMSHEFLHQDRRIPTLKAFTKLKDLFLDTPDICTTQSGRFSNEISTKASLVDILPPNIHSLELAMHVNLEENLLKLLEAKATLFPLLRTVKIDRFVTFDEDLMAIAAQVGVQLIHQDLQRNHRRCTGQLIVRILESDSCYHYAQEGWQPLPGELSDDDL